MSKRLPKPIVIDMLHCLERILEYTNNMTFDSFLSGSKTQDAVVRNIQVIGETASRMPETFKLKFPEIEWSKIIRSRHIVTHEYDAVDYQTIWKIVTVYSPALKQSLEKILKLL